MALMNITTEQLEKAKQSAEALYATIGLIHCPYLQDNVSFNAKGLDHIKFKEWNKARSAGDQYVRLRLLKLAPEVIKNSHTLQEYKEESRFERVKRNSNWERILKTVKYYGFVSIIKGCRVKIVVKEIVGGDKFFWSLIPFWKQRNQDGTNKKVLHVGDPETD